jgi:tRNA pseudouridine38-40 synthase
MPRYKLTIEYLGTKYHGWQIQKNARTIQGDLSDVIRRVTGESSFELYGSGRTDAGVHALRQTAHLELKNSQPGERLRIRLNDDLPADIHVLRIESASPRFHARHSAVARSYLYQISRRRTAFGKRLVWWIKDELDFDRMKKAAVLFLGMKNCESFAANDPDEKSTRVLIDRIQMREVGDLILIRIEGSHFLWGMVRRIVGVLAEAGRGRLSLDAVAGFLETRSAEPARLAAPPSGLFLERVYYQGDERLQALSPVLRLSSD